MQVVISAQLWIVIQFRAPESVLIGLLDCKEISGVLTRCRFWNPKASMLLTIAFSFPSLLMFSRRTTTVLVLKATADAILLFLDAEMQEARNRVALSSCIQMYSARAFQISASIVALSKLRQWVSIATVDQKINV